MGFHVPLFVMMSFDNFMILFRILEIPTELVAGQDTSSHEIRGQVGIIHRIVPFLGVFAVSYGFLH